MTKHLAAGLLTLGLHPLRDARCLLPSQISPMTGLRQRQLGAVYSGGTVRGSHTVPYSSERGAYVAADTAGVMKL